MDMLGMSLPGLNTRRGCDHGQVLAILEQEGATFRIGVVKLFQFREEHVICISIGSQKTSKTQVAENLCVPCKAKVGKATSPAAHGAAG
jgi:hypothetical protein